MKAQQKTTYKDAGVDIERGDAFVDSIRKRVESTYNNRVVSGVGGFAALYDMQDGRYLAAGTDGVGTKVKVAQGLRQHDTIGIDLVAMCVNDVICTGARPLFFLDYIATGKLELDVAGDIIKGIVEGCKQAGAALIGGETAEMPGVYPPGEYDLAGFCVGEVQKKDLVDGSAVQEGDTLIALPSSGIHSNGYSLVRKLVVPWEEDLMRQCLAPTRIYWNVVSRVLPLVRGMAHITGGGISNIPRMNEGFDYHIDYLPPLSDIPFAMAEIARRSGMEGKELYETFNMGIGFVLATAKPDAVIGALFSMNEPFWRIGHVVKGSGRAVVRAPGLDFSC